MAGPLSLTNRRLSFPALVVNPLNLNCLQRPLQNIARYWSKQTGIPLQPAFSDDLPRKEKGEAVQHLEIG